jgi:hypothetical protein
MRADGPNDRTGWTLLPCCSKLRLWCATGQRGELTVGGHDSTNAFGAEKLYDYISGPGTKVFISIWVLCGVCLAEINLRNT